MNKTGNITTLIKSIPDYRLFMLLKAKEAIDAYNFHFWETKEKCDIMKRMASDYYMASKLPEKEINNIIKCPRKSETLF